MSVRHIVEANHLKIGRDRHEMCVSAITALLRVFDRGGNVVLGKALRALRDAFAGDPDAFDGLLVEGVGWTFTRFDGRIDEKHLIAQLSAIQHGHRGVRRRAEAQRERTGNQLTQCLAATIVDIYNRGTNAHSRSRLPSWWKSRDGDEDPKPTTATKVDGEKKK